jgi:hypothetical protein
VAIPLNAAIQWASNEQKSVVASTSTASLDSLLGTLIEKIVVGFMGIFNRFAFLSFRQRPATPPIQPSAPPQQSLPTSKSSQQPPAPQQSAPPQPKLKTLTELEREMAAEAQSTQQSIQTHFPQKLRSPRRSRNNPFRKVIGVAVLVGIPIGALWIINLPYPPIRRPIARSAPILLLPSYISLDNNYRQAIALVEQAKQLIDNATTPADLDLGADKAEQAKASLDALSPWLWQDLPDHQYWWYDWRLSPSGFNASRAEVGRLQAKVFQERNAQNALLEADQALGTAKQQYQQSKTAVDRQQAVAAWRSALDQLQQVPGQTLAGKTAQQKSAGYQRDFRDVVGLAAGNEQTAALIEAARDFAWKAAQAGQNPPHSEEQWQQVSDLWQEAMNRLTKIPSSDPEGYAEAQQLLATYRDNQGQIEIRQAAERKSAAALQAAKRQTASLTATIPVDAKAVNRNTVAAQLQGIIALLEEVQPGTTAYLEAQSDLLFAKEKLKQLQPK